MVEPRRAPVRPRVLSPVTGDPLLLEDELRALLESSACGTVYLMGPPGSGKTTALLHLAAVLPPDSRAALADASDTLSWEHLAPQGKNLLIVAAKKEGVAPLHVAGYKLAPWGEDECLEYLLAVHRESCASVMARLRAVTSTNWVGIPEVWRVVLDEMAADESLPGVREAVRRFLYREMGNDAVAKRAQAVCFNMIVQANQVLRVQEKQFVRCGCSERVVRLLRHSTVQFALTVDFILAGLIEGAACDYLRHRLPVRLIRAAAEAVGRAPRALEHLKRLLKDGDNTRHPMAASIFHATDTGWVPEGDPLPKLSGAYLPEVAWPYVNLAGAELVGADMTRAYLRGAVLDWARARKANLREARLQAASLQAFMACEADLTGADLSSVKGEQARFHGARLERAHLEGASLGGLRLPRPI
jgi:energy-coupling factor transporter ATP-binding protein EcfA2